MNLQHYWELRLACHPEAAEALTNYLWEAGAVGVVEEEGLRAFFPAAQSPDAIRRDLAAYMGSLEALGLSGVSGPIELHRLAARAWDTAWQAHFRPLRVGRFWIAPPWERPRVGAGAHLIQIRPGRAFGTGQHETTQLCLKLLDGLGESPPHRALDIGTGTGILAIAAVRLGVAECLAIDTDPDAVAAARDNVELNRVGRRVRVRVATPAQVAEPPFALLLANLLTETHQALLPDYRRLMIPGGRAILGGILTTDEDQMAAALGAHGFDNHERIRKAEWCAFCVERPRA